MKALITANIFDTKNYYNFLRFDSFYLIMIIIITFITFNFCITMKTPKRLF